MRIPTEPRGCNGIMPPGTTALFVALNIANGRVLTQCRVRHRHQEFLGFLKHIDVHVPQSLAVHLVVDNYAAHKRRKCAPDSPPGRAFIFTSHRATRPASIGSSTGLRCSLSAKSAADHSSVPRRSSPKSKLLSTPTTAGALPSSGPPTARPSSKRSAKYGTTHQGASYSRACRITRHHPTRSESDAAAR